MFTYYHQNEKEEVQRQKDTDLQEMTSQLQQKDDELCQKGEALKQKDIELQEKSEALRRKDIELAEFYQVQVRGTRWEMCFLPRVVRS